MFAALCLRRVARRLLHGEISDEADAIIVRVRPISDEKRLSGFTNLAVYYDGVHELEDRKDVVLALELISVMKAITTSTAELDQMLIELSSRSRLSVVSQTPKVMEEEDTSDNNRGNVLVVATLLHERIMRDSKILGSGIIKMVSLFNHIIDTSCRCAERNCDNTCDTRCQTRS